MIDHAGARAIEEQLCFAAVWSGMSWDEAGENIFYEVETSYMASQATVQEFVSLIGTNLSMGEPFLSRQKMAKQPLHKMDVLDYHTKVQGVANTVADLLAEALEEQDALLLVMLQMELRIVREWIVTNLKSPEEVFKKIGIHSKANR